MSDSAYRVKTWAVVWSGLVLNAAIIVWHVWRVWRYHHWASIAIVLAQSFGFAMCIYSLRQMFRIRKIYNSLPKNGD